jgi:hypothetical protein
LLSSLSIIYTELLQHYTYLISYLSWLSVPSAPRAPAPLPPSPLHKPHSNILSKSKSKINYLIANLNHIASLLTPLDLTSRGPAENMVLHMLGPSTTTSSILSPNPTLSPSPTPYLILLNSSQFPSNCTTSGTSLYVL